MLKKTSAVLAIASSLFVSAVVSQAQTISQNFAGDPLTNGWSIFGDATLFSWDATNQNLQVTWDSTHTNSYFYRSLGTTVTRYDDFQIEFDLNLSDCISGNEPGKTGPLQIGIGLINYARATNASFGRGIFGSAPNIAEFNYFPYGFYTFGSDIFPSPATTVYDFISSGGFSYTPIFFSPTYEFEMPTNVVVHLTMKYTAKNQTLAMKLTTNNVVAFAPADVVLNNPGNSGFTTNDDFIVDTFSVSSYSSFGDDYNSVLGHATLDNFVITVPAVQDLTGAVTNGVWASQFRSKTNWNYTLQRTTDFTLWTNVSATVSGNAANLFLQDTNPPVNKAFYRVNATKP
jgi:hypothetical protein